MRHLDQIAPEDPDVGGKAQGLARLWRAGLRVPEAFVLPAEAYRAALAAQGGAPNADDPATLDAAAARLRAAPLAPALAQALDDAAARLGAPLAVRSSASCEDAAASRAPGLFRSRLDVAPGAALHEAVREVWSSLLSPTVAAYLAGRGLRLADAAMAVIVQRRVRGRLAGTAYTRAPGDDAHVLVEAPTGRAVPDVALVSREARAIVAASGAFAAEPAVAARIAEAALAAEAALGAPADVEWVLADELWLVQARPIGPAGAARPGAATATAAPAPAFDAAALPGDAVWTWDATHNPDPLSPAQEGLVALVDAAGVAPLRQRVVDGYLYTAPAPPPAGTRAIAPADLARAWDEELRPALERALVPLDADAPDLEDALAAYLDVYRLYAGTLAPAVSAARRVVPDLLRRRFPAEQAAALAARLVAGATGAGRPAPAIVVAWDVALPPAASPAGAAAAPPAPAPDATALEEATRGLAPDERAALAAALPSARAAAAIAEEDDLFFARAQAGVRRALAALAARWGVALDDLVFVPLADVRAAARAGAPPADVAARAAAARARHERRRGIAPPLQVVAGRPVTPATPGDGALLRGRGTGGRARGQVLHFRPENGPPPPAPGRILVVATVLPTMAPLLQGVAGVVAEHGGQLGHGAALARELGVPCVIGCAGALAALHDGDRVWLDADAGLVIRL